MPTLNECCEQIEELVVEKKFHRDTFFNKLIWAFVELAEVIDKIKKNGLPDPDKFQRDDGTNYAIPEDYVHGLGEEIIDGVFYHIDAYRLLRRRYPWLLPMDDMFNYKMQKNMNRPKRYGQSFMDEQIKMIMDHYEAEGLLNELIENVITYAAELQPIKSVDSKSAESDQ